jgi:hypothetical protein
MLRFVGIRDDRIFRGHEKPFPFMQYLNYLLNNSNFRTSSELQNTFILLNQLILTKMKKVFFVLVIMMSVLTINAQTTKTSTTKEKSPKTAVKVADLPKAITDNVAKDYAGFTIKEASSTTSNNALTYHVVVTKGTTTETLVYDKDGKFVKKLTPSSGKKSSTKKK